MGETTSSSSSGASGSASQSAASAQASHTAQTSQTSQQSQSLQSLESVISQNSAKEIGSDIVSGLVSELKQAGSKSYLLSEKLQKEGKKPELYKKEMNEGKQVKQESTKTKYVEADVCTASKKCKGTMTPTNPDSNKPVNMSDTNQVLTAVFKYSLDSMAFKAGLFTSLFWKLLTQMYSNCTEKMRLPCAEAAYV
jgi:hypothetical protein